MIDTSNFDTSNFAVSLARHELEAAALRFALACSGDLLPTPEVHGTLLDAALRYCRACDHPSQ